MELLLFADGLRRSQEDLEGLKRAMVSAGVPVEALFSPEVEAWSGDPVDDEGVDFDYSAVQWDTTAAPSDWDLMQAALADNRVTIREASDSSPSLLPDVPFETDREWT